MSLGCRDRWGERRQARPNRLRSPRRPAEVIRVHGFYRHKNRSNVAGRTKRLPVFRSGNSLRRGGSGWWRKGRHRGEIGAEAFPHVAALKSNFFREGTGGRVARDRPPPAEYGRRQPSWRSTSVDRKIRPGSPAAVEGTRGNPAGSVSCHSFGRPMVVSPVPRGRWVRCSLAEAGIDPTRSGGTRQNERRGCRSRVFGDPSPRSEGASRPVRSLLGQAGIGKG